MAAKVIPLDLTVTLNLPVLHGAACAGMAPAFDLGPLPDETPTAQRARWAAAAEVCGTCPVRARCADAATSRDRGVWAGRVLGAPRWTADAPAARLAA